MAFRKKAHVISAFSPDILIVPECECPEKLSFDLYTSIPKQTLWFGQNPNKGLGIFSYSDYRFQLLDLYEPGLKTIIPLTVSNEKFSFVLFAIWANHPADKGFEYVGQIWKALSHYRELLKHPYVILIGDFNSNTIWDKPRREGNHSTVVDRLKALDIHSCYHQQFGLQQGKEKHSTLFMYRKKDMGYHIDYCFASRYFSDRLKSIEIGRHHDWRAFSDHTPLVVDFEI